MIGVKGSTEVIVIWVIGNVQQGVLLVHTYTLFYLQVRLTFILILHHKIPYGIQHHLVNSFIYFLERAFIFSIKK